MNIILNGEPLETTSETLAELLLSLDYADSHIATAVNSEFVPHTQRSEVTMNDGDRIEIIAPMAGG